jgi:transposase InsO family protein
VIQKQKQQLLKQQKKWHWNTHYMEFRRITAMLHRSGITANRKKVYRLLKLANLVRKRSVRKHVKIKRILTVPERPDQLWQQDITYIWCGHDRWCYLFSILDVILENGLHTHSVPNVVQIKP